MESKFSIAWIVIIVMLLLVGCFNVTKEQSVSESIVSKEGIDTDMEQGEFNIEYAYWYDDERKNVFSTYEDYIQKDLIDAGVINEEWQISYGDAKQLEKIVRDYKLSEYDEKYMCEGAMTPVKEFYIKFTIGDKDYLIKGNETIIMEGRTKSKENENFCKALEKLEYVFKNQKTYLNMPESEGGYD